MGEGKRAGARTAQNSTNQTTPKLTTTNRAVSLAELRPHPRNYNRHPASQIERIGASLRKFGQPRSIVVWRSTILAGHGVVEAARALGWQELRADVLDDDYPEHLALAYVAADNELGRLGDPDQAALAAILEESRAADAELLEAMGYSDKEFQALLEEVGATAKAQAGDTPAQVDRAEELRQKWQVEPGQLWQLGEHRLICGDCTDAAVVARVMGGEKANGIATDPPYAFGLSSTANEGSKAGGWHDMMNNASWFADRLRQWSEIAPDSIWWMFCNWRTLPIVMKAGADAKEAVISVMIWNKDWIGPGGTRGLRPSYEMIALFANGNGAIEDRGRPDIVTIGWSSHKPTGHAAEKPVDLLAHLIGMIGGRIVFEPFSGSGTTLIACENLGRRCRAVEISPGYVAVALERFHQHTGQTPTLVEAA